MDIHAPVPGVITDQQVSNAVGVQGLSGPNSFTAPEPGFVHRLGLPAVVHAQRDEQRLSRMTQQRPTSGSATSSNAARNVCAVCKRREVINIPEVIRPPRESLGGLICEINGGRSSRIVLAHQMVEALHRAWRQIRREYYRRSSSRLPSPCPRRSDRGHSCRPAAKTVDCQP